MTRVGSTLLKVCPACNDNIAFNSQWQFDRLFSCQSPFWLVVVESPVAQYGHVWFRPESTHCAAHHRIVAARARRHSSSSSAFFLEHLRNEPTLLNSPAEYKLRFQAFNISRLVRNFQETFLTLRP